MASGKGTCDEEVINVSKIEIELDRNSGLTALEFTLDLVKQLDNYVLVRDVSRYLQVYIESEEEIERYNKKREGYID